MSTQTTDADVQQLISAIEKSLAGREAEVDAYRFNPAVIRMRVTSGEFDGLSYVEREALLSEALSDLSDELAAQLTTLILVTPDERAATPQGVSRESMLNYEFENPEAF